MALTSTELDVLEQLARGNTLMRTIMASLDKSQPQVYRAARTLEEKGFATRSRGRISPSGQAFTTLLLQLVITFPNLKALLADSGIPLLTGILTSKSIKELEKGTGLAKSTIYKKLKEAHNISVVKKQRGKYVFNDQLWGKLRQFLMEYKEYQENVDSRVPLGSVIYYKTNEEIIFSSKQELDATLTGFSAFEQHGIKLLMHTYYYYIPNKKLSLSEVFRHTLHIIEKERTVYNLILTTLFYAKHKKSLRIQHPIIDNIKKVLAGKRVDDYPSLEEIRDRAEVYDIKL